ncbi:MAG: histidine phosphatase family protein [Clostridia bacterium]|nr:histidine phosphatase family protein [Clostridia bacterium]
MTRIIAVRHAQSEGNLGHFFCGHTDVALTPHGHLQAEATACYIAEHYAVDRIYSSDLIRVVMTARHTADKLGLPLELTRDLREINVGDWEGLTYDEVNDRWPAENHVWRNDFAHAACPGGESVRGLFDRINLAFRRLAEENDGKTIALFSHATPIRSMLTAWQGLPFEAISTTPWPPNASVTVVDYLDDGSMVLREKAVTAHFDAKGIAYSA